MWFVHTPISRGSRRQEPQGFTSCVWVFVCIYKLERTKTPPLHCIAQLKGCIKDGYLHVKSDFHSDVKRKITFPTKPPSPSELYLAQTIYSSIVRRQVINWFSFLLNISILSCAILANLAFCFCFILYLKILRTLNKIFFFSSLFVNRFTKKCKQQRGIWAFWFGTDSSTAHQPTGCPWTRLSPWAAALDPVLPVLSKLPPRSSDSSWARAKSFAPVACVEVHSVLQQHHCGPVLTESALPQPSFLSGPLQTSIP